MWLSSTINENINTITVVLNGFFALYTEYQQYHLGLFIISFTILAVSSLILILYMQRNAYERLRDELRDKHNIDILAPGLDPVVNTAFLQLMWKLTMRKRSMTYTSQRFPDSTKRFNSYGLSIIKDRVIAGGPLALRYEVCGEVVRCRRTGIIVSSDVAFIALLYSMRHAVPVLGPVNQ